MKKERAQSQDQAALRALRAEYAERRSGHITGAMEAQWGASAIRPAPAIGWPIWLAWIISLLAFFPAAVIGLFIGLAALTPLTLDSTLLKTVLLIPVLAGVLALPGLIFALLATRRARKIAAGVATPITLVGLATVVLVAGLLFGGLVAYPRYQLGNFGQAIKAHCARVGQSLQPYLGLSATQLAPQIPALAITLQNDANDLPGDQAALNDLSSPEPKYQPLLDDCRVVATKDQQLLSTLPKELVALPPNPGAAQTTLKQYQTDTTRTLTEIQHLGDALQREVFAPFQPG